jgi:hypothetical protein
MRRAARQQHVMRGDGIGFVLTKIKKHGGIDHGYRPVNFCQSGIRGSKER